MNLHLSNDEVIDLFRPGGLVHRLKLNQHRVEFENEAYQEHGIAEYERCGWTIIAAGICSGGYYFTAVKQPNQPEPCLTPTS